MNQDNVESEKAFDEFDFDGEEIDLTNTEFEGEFSPWELRSNRALVRKSKKVILTNAQHSTIISYVIEGLDDEEIRTLTKIPLGVISQIRNNLPKAIKERSAIRSENLMATMVEELLRQSLSGAVALSKQVHNEAWRNNQSASDLAKLYTTLADKSIQILEASERSKQEEFERQRFFIENRERIEAIATTEDDSIRGLG